MNAQEDKQVAAQTLNARKPPKGIINQSNVIRDRVVDLRAVRPGLASVAFEAPRNVRASGFPLEVGTMQESCEFLPRQSPTKKVNTYQSTSRSSLHPRTTGGRGKRAGWRGAAGRSSAASCCSCPGRAGRRAIVGRGTRWAPGRSRLDTSPAARPRPRTAPARRRALRCARSSRPSKHEGASKG